MQAEDYLREGNLEAALEQLMAQVRSDPASSKHRTFLFQLFSVLGQWGRALTQLNTAGDMDDSTLAMVHTYRELLQCEALRADIYSGDRSPLIFGEPEEWVALMLQALKLDGQGHHSQAAEVRAKALEQAPATSGTINDEPFEWIADADSRIGPCLEAIINGNYYWVPFNRVSAIAFEEPEDLRDMVWTPAQFHWSNGGEVVGFIPTRYANTENQDDGLLRLARKTEWTELSENNFAGLGQRILTTDANDYPLLDARTITLNTVPAEA